jgi:hypothetical protein
MLLCPQNPFSHPSPEVVERLIDRLGEDNVYRTDEDGTIELITDGERLWVSDNKFPPQNLIVNHLPSHHFVSVEYGYPT